MKLRSLAAFAVLVVLPRFAFAQETRPKEWVLSEVAKLAQGSEKDRLAALFFLEDTRSTDVGIWKMLLGKGEPIPGADPPPWREDRKYLARVIRGLGRVGEPELKPLLKRMLDESGEPAWTRDFQRAMGLAVGLFGDPELTWGASFDRPCRFFAIGLMKKLPREDVDYVRYLKGNDSESRPADSGSETFDDPGEAALRWGATLEAPEFADAAGRTLAASDSTSLRRRAAVDYFARSKSKAPADLRPVLATLLRSEDPELAGLAARALAKSEGAGEAEAAAIEAAFVGATNRITRVDEVRGLAALQIPRAFDALMHMLELSKGDPAVRRTVLESLRAVAPKLPDETKKTVAAAIHPIIEPEEGRVHEPPDVAAAAVTLLTLVDPARFTVLLPAFRLSAIWQVRAAAAAATAALPDPRVFGRHWFLYDPDRRVRVALLEAMAEKPPRTTAQDYERIILALLGPTGMREGAISGWHARTSDPVELGVTAALLDTALDHRTSMHPPPPVFEFDWFPEVAAKLIPDHEVEPLQAVLDLAGKLKTDRGNAVLQGYLMSPEISLRKRAKDLLIKNGIQAFEVAPPNPALFEVLDAAIERAKEVVENPVSTAVIETNKGNITIKLFASDAPATVENFLNLARSGFYDGILWHRVVPAFVAQAGCPRGDGWGGPGYTIRCEVNDRTYRRGSVGMALAGKDTGGCQFFICHRSTPHLDGRYTLFGQVTEGMDVVDRLGQEDYILKIREL